MASTRKIYSRDYRGRKYFARMWHSKISSLLSNNAVEGMRAQSWKCLKYMQRTNTTILVAPPLPRIMVFTFWTRDSSLHLVFISSPYAWQIAGICLPSSFSFGAATVTRKSSTSGALFFISSTIFIHDKELDKFFWSSLDILKMDGCPFVLTHNCWHCFSTFPVSCSFSLAVFSLVSLKGQASRLRYCSNLGISR